MIFVVASDAWGREVSSPKTRPLTPFQSYRDPALHNRPKYLICQGIRGGAVAVGQYDDTDPARRFQKQVRSISGEPATVAGDAPALGREYSGVI